MHISRPIVEACARGAPRARHRRSSEADELDDGEGRSDDRRQLAATRSGGGSVVPAALPRRRAASRRRSPSCWASGPHAAASERRSASRLTGPVPQAASTACRASPPSRIPQSFSGQIPNDCPSGTEHAAASRTRIPTWAWAVAAATPGQRLRHACRCRCGPERRFAERPARLRADAPGMPGQNLSRIQPTVQQNCIPTTRTTTAQRLEAPPPMWVIAALSCSVALVAGILIAILRRPRPLAPAASGLARRLGHWRAMVGPVQPGARTAFTHRRAPPPAPPLLPPGPTGGVMVLPNGTRRRRLPPSPSPRQRRPPPRWSPRRTRSRPSDGQPTQPPARLSQRPAPLPPARTRATPPPNWARWAAPPSMACSRMKMRSDHRQRHAARADTFSAGWSWRVVTRSSERAERREEERNGGSPSGIS